MRRLAVVFICFIIYGCLCEEENVERDSYIDAYHESHENIKSRNVRKHSPYYDDSGPEGYGLQHGYPEPHYPPSNYGPPIYGPPGHIPSFPVPFYGVPHAMMGLLDKLHLKLDIYTILKIILKLVIFKKIVSFIALICLLLFIPKFKISKNDIGMDDLETRSIDNKKWQGKVNEHLNLLAKSVLGAIEKYSKNNNSTCGGVKCDINSILKKIDNKYSYQRLLKKYATEENKTNIL